MRAGWLTVAAVVACGGGSGAPIEQAGSASGAAAAGAGGGWGWASGWGSGSGSGWPELAAFDRATPLRVVSLPVKATEPRFDVGGPAITGDGAVGASSHFGFIAIDWRRGTTVWSKPAGSRVAPPVVVAK